MSKSKKKRELNPDKFRTTLYLDKDLVEYAREIRLKLSGFLNAAIYRVRLLHPNIKDANSLNLDVLLKTGANTEASGESRTRGLFLTKDALGVNSQTEPVTGFSENETSEFLTPPA